MLQNHRNYNLARWLGLEGIQYGLSTSRRAVRASRNTRMTLPQTEPRLLPRCALPRGSLRPAFPLPRSRDHQLLNGIIERDAGRPGRKRARIITPAGQGDLPSLVACMTIPSPTV